VALGALAPSFPVTAHPRPALAVTGLLAGAAVALAPAYLPRPARTVAAAVALPLAAAALWAARGTPVVHAIARSRGNLESSGRTDAIHAAVHLVAARPLTGTGVGQARFLWLTPDGNAQIAQYVHDEYLQTLVDLGAIGLTLLLALLAAVVVTVHRGRAATHSPGVRAGAIAALAALAAHSGFDFLWHIAVLPLAGALFLGLAAPVTGGTVTQPEGEPECTSPVHGQS
jgi:O-antigen ligase